MSRAEDRFAEFSSKQDFIDWLERADNYQGALDKLKQAVLAYDWNAQAWAKAFSGISSWFYSPNSDKLGFSGSGFNATSAMEYCIERFEYDVTWGASAPYLYSTLLEMYETYSTGDEQRGVNLDELFVRHRIHLDLAMDKYTLSNFSSRSDLTAYLNTIDCTDGDYMAYPVVVAVDRLMSGDWNGGRNNVTLTLCANKIEAKNTKAYLEARSDTENVTIYRGLKDFLDSTNLFGSYSLLFDWRYQGQRVKYDILHEEARSRLKGMKS